MASQKIFNIKKSTGVFFVIRIATFRSINLRQMYPQKPTAGSPEKTEKKHRHNWQITNLWGSSFQGCIHSYQKCKLAPRWFPNHPSSNPPPGVTQVASYDQHILGLFFEKISGPLHLLNGTLNHPQRGTFAEFPGIHMLAVWHLLPLYIQSHWNWSGMTHRTLKAYRKRTPFTLVFAWMSGASVKTAVFFKESSSQSLGM